MAISMDEYTKKYKTQIENNRKNLTYLSAAEQLKYQKNKEAKAKQLADNLAQKNNINKNYVDTRNVPTRATALQLATAPVEKYGNVNSTIEEKINNKNNLLPLNQGNKYEILDKKVNDIQKKYTDYYNSDEYQNYVKEYYKTPLYQYNADVEKVSNQDKFSKGEKLFTSFFGGLRSAMHMDRQYKTTDSNGKTVYVDLPNLQQLKSQKLMENTNSIGKIYQEAMASIGQMVPSITAGAVTGGLGLSTELGSLGVMAINAYSGSKNQMLLDGYSKKQAETYGALSAAVEVATEKMFGGLGKLMGTGALDEVITEKLTKNITNRVAKGLAELGISSIGEGVEEVVSGLAQPIIQKLALGKKEDYLTLLKDESLSEDFFAGVLSSAILGGVTGVGKGINNKVNVNNQNVNIQEANNIQNELKEDKITSNNTDIIQNNNLNNNQNTNVNNNSDINSVLSQINELKQLQSNNELNLIQYQELKKLQKQLSVLQEQNQNTEITQNTNNQNNLKEQQNNIIQNSNPVNDDYHTWIRSVDDIKTFSEALNDSDYKEYFEAGENFDETYTADMAKMALETGKITVYSSYPIEQGTFVSPSKMEAESYSGIGKVYSKEVNLTDIAWIDPTQGQYAKVNPKILPTIDTSSVNVSPTSTIVPIDNNLSNDILSDNTNENNIENDLNYSSNTSLSFSEQLDLWVQGKWNNRSQLVLFKHTPQLYLELGLNDNPITVSASKLDRIINASGKQNGTYHNLGLETTKQLPNAIANPLNILESSTIDDSIVVVTELSDKEGRIVIVSLAIDGKGHIEVTDINNNNEIKRLSSNVMTSAYGRNNYETWMESNRDRIIYDKDDGIMKKRINGEWLQLPKGTNPFIENNIPQSDNDVKSDTSLNSMSNNLNNNKQSKNKTLNPIEISQLKPEDANTTPPLPGTKRNKFSDGESKFYDNIKDKTDMLNDEQKGVILSDDEVKYYDKVTNKESLNEAFARLNADGELEVNRWFKKKENIDSTDVAEGYILLKQYADKSQNTTDLIEKNYYNEAMVDVAKKMRDIGTKAGQTVQAFKIMERMSPEGMVKYAQSELSEAYNKMVQGKTKEWIDKYRNNFELTPDDVQFIMDTMQEVSTMEDGYDKKVKLAQIQKLMTDKLPPQRGAKIKSWMRISMLFNPKTQVRNVAGNALIMPVNAFGDLFSSYTDKIIARKTGVRTTGNTNIKAMLKGMKRGAYEATNDYKMGINTKDMDGNRFEISDGKSFSDKNIVGKTLNRTESLLNYVMDVGDRVFSEASFENSLQNQMVLNNTTEITKEMIDIAHQEALSRTWNDNNNYTKFVLNARSGLNQFLNFKGYGLGDVLIPFAKTPANLTKAIVEYSPVGLVSTLKSGINLNRSLTNGQYTAQMQHDFVQKLGKATAGTMLYVLGVALAKAGITSGESDDDKDTRNFLQNALGISSYSIKIGDKTFTYDWAQPLAAPLSITANVVNSNSNKETALLEAILGSLDTAGAILLEQSFLQSINDVLTDNDGFVSGLITEILELPARAIPTFSKQIADMVDGTKRQTFEYDKPIKSAYNYAKSKIPGLSKTLAPSVDTMGREIQKYGGKNNIFNVFLNPANVNTENISESAKEIYRLYEETGDTTIMPRVAPYYINKNNEKITLNSTQRAEYQKVSGKIIEDSIQALLKNSQYKNMPDVEKADIINDIVNYSYNVAQSEVLGTEISSTYEKAYLYSKVGNVYDYYIFKSQEFTSDKDKNGKTISGSKKKKIIKYINSMNISAVNKAILIKFNNYSVEGYDKMIINYINSQNLTKEEKSKILTELGYTIKNGKVYVK